MLTLTAACAFAEINVTLRELSQVRGLDKSVSHILVLLRDSTAVDTLMLASINSKTGRAVMTRVDTTREIEVTLGDGSAQMAAIEDVYEMGGKKSKGLLVCREMNELLGLDISTFVALDMEQLPAIVDSLGTLILPLTLEEANAMGKPFDYVPLTGEEVLQYVRLELEGDDAARSRCYDALIQMIYQGIKGGDIKGLMSMGTKMLKSMDTNLNPMTAMTLVGAVQAGEDRRQVFVPADMAEADVQSMIRTEIYE
jgi:anionic cell wall polymer biosynthesis LytR-Cps2A-Psr (LCP) family protein